MESPFTFSISGAVLSRRRSGKGSFRPIGLSELLLPPAGVHDLWTGRVHGLLCKLAVSRARCRGQRPCSSGRGRVVRQNSTDRACSVLERCRHFARLYSYCWWRGTVVERRSVAGELSLSCARPAADG